ncbi:hypothetical protein L3i22_037950 [Actinoplanes sp. L3-i22]|nr:hypothetical protein L3i22_037950 [Actinoplanes sp. L3-i22]
MGHSQLVLRAQVPGRDEDEIDVLFEGVRAIKLRMSYKGLVIRTADASTRARMLDYAGVPEFLRQRELCLTLPAEDDGFVVCAKATVLTGKRSGDQSGWRLPEPATVLHTLTSPDQVPTE